MDCKHCSKKIPGYDKRQIYCCKACYASSCVKIRDPKVCKECACTFAVNARNQPNKFCSVGCFHKHNSVKERVEKTCPECNNLFYVLPGQSHRIHCGKRCKYSRLGRITSEKRKGCKGKGLEESPNYRDGINCYRRRAFNAYPNRCAICSRDDRVLQVHHKDRNRRNNDIRNLEILCASCHRKLHVSKSFVRPDPSDPDTSLLLAP